MRLELSPWGIKCILVVEGEIRTKFFENLPEVHHIPQGSLYSPAKTEVEHGMSGADLEKSAMDVDWWGCVHNMVCKRLWLVDDMGKSGSPQVLIPYLI
jgi:hypothetical protein